MMQNVLIGTRHVKQVQTLVYTGMAWVLGGWGEGGVQDKVGKRVKSILVSTSVQGGLSFTQILFGNGVEVLITMTVNFKKRKNR